MEGTLLTQSIFHSRNNLNWIGVWSVIWIEVDKMELYMTFHTQSRSLSGVLIGVLKSTLQKYDSFKNGVHSKMDFGFGVRIALRNVGVLKYPVC